METLWSIEDSWLGRLVSSSEWGYPIVLSLHALGMAILVGVSLILALRILGFGKSVPISSLRPYWSIALGGFIVNLLSGAALFMGSASLLFFNTAFHIKLVMVVIGILLTWRLVKVCLGGTGDISMAHRTLAGTATLAWVVALVAGRLIGYYS